MTWPHPAHYTLPTPSSGPFAHPKRSTNNIPTTIPSFSPRAPPSPPSATSSILSEKSLRESSVKSYPTLTDIPQFPTLPSIHSNVPSPTNSMSSATLPNYEGDSAKIVSPAMSNMVQIPGDNTSPPYHAFTRKVLVPMHSKTQTSIDMKYTSPKKMTSTY